MRGGSALAGLALAVLLTSWPGIAVAESSFEQEVRLLTDLLDVGPGDALADIGAGEGEYAVAMAEIVGPGGVVYATELDDDKRVALEALKEESDLEQLRVVKGEYAATALELGSVDAAFLRDVYHHITEPEKFMASLFRTIRPGGRLVLIDFPPTLWLALWTPEGIPENRGGHGIETELLIAEAKAAGFVPLQTIETWPSSNFVTKTYAVAFERPLY
jgi:ubiquinone/menaquinone biosynthesis C-methylase UbiE